ncbi:MAG: peroxiredoxin, partial [Calditrichaeota bacterium]|nr:peroxiredoxin [Calditrichota bacterium]
KSEFAKLNAEIYGLSKDSESSHQKFIDKHQLNFSLIVDKDGDLINKLGMWQKKKLYGKEYMGIVRSTFIIDPDGIIKKIYENVKVKDHSTEVFNDLKTVQAS